jgi:hypothetical protein
VQWFKLRPGELVVELFGGHADGACYPLDEFPDVLFVDRQFIGHHRAMLRTVPYFPTGERSRSGWHVMRPDPVRALALLSFPPP